jgi:hypothetical protein
MKLGVMTKITMGNRMVLLVLSLFDNMISNPSSQRTQ